MLKLIYLAQRKPGFTFDEFVRRWRKHGALGMEQSSWRNVLGYVQAEPVIPAPMAGASEAFDAVACFMVRDNLFTDMTDEDVAGTARMAEDELKTFSGPIPDVSLWVKEERIKPGELGGITAYLFFESADAARKTAERAKGADSLNRIILNVRDDGPVAEMNTLPYQAVVELSAASVPALAKAVGSNDTNLLNTADVAVVTREAVFWDRMS